MSDFHVWQDLPSGRSRCRECEVVTPVRAVLPIFCPGEVRLAHRFTGTPERLTCSKCGLAVPRGTMPNEMHWICDTP